MPATPTNWLRACFHALVRGPACAVTLALALVGLCRPGVAQPWPAEPAPSTRPVVRQPAAAKLAPQKGGDWNAQAKPPATSGTTATALKIEGDDRRTHVRLLVDRPLAASIFTLGDPYRVVIDAENVKFSLPAGSGRAGHGLISGYRYGQFEAGRSRVVMDANAPVLIEKAEFVPAAGREPAHLRFDLVRISADQFTAQTRKPPAASGGTPLRETIVEEAAAPPSLPGAKARPVIVIDPGHGGIDPGTVSSTNVYEKSVVLAVGVHLRNLLQQTRRFDVHMTRQEDVFVSLDKRLRLSGQHGADLFVSIHADALSLAERDIAQSISGATVYTLSEKASDETARKLAEKENSADLLAGLDAVPASDEDQVRSILIDLVRRETSNFAAEFRSHVVQQLKGKVPLSKDPQRSAAFKVLKQAETPAVLIELGYMSNADDLSRLSKPEWQRQAAASIAQAVETYFAKRTARARN